MATVQRGQRVEASAVARGVDELTLGRMQIGDGFRAAGADDRALMLRGQEGVGPVLRAIGGEATMIWQHDERGQVLRLATERVAHP